MTINSKQLGVIIDDVRDILGDLATKFTLKIATTNFQPSTGSVTKSITNVTCFGLMESIEPSEADGSLIKVTDTRIFLFLPAECHGIALVGSKLDSLTSNYSIIQCASLILGSKTLLVEVIAR